MAKPSENTIYRISLNVIGEELTYLWVQAQSRRDAVEHVKYNIHPRATIQDVNPHPKPNQGTTIHVVDDSDVQTKRNASPATST